MKLLLLALVPACFAFNPVAGRALVDAFGPATLTLVRWSLSGLVIGTFALMRHGNERWQASLSQLLQLAILAAFGMGFCSIAAYLASRTTEATNIGLIYGCASAFVAVWEIVARRQTASPQLLVGIFRLPPRRNFDSHQRPYRDNRGSAVQSRRPVGGRGHA